MVGIGTLSLKSPPLIFSRAFTEYRVVVGEEEQWLSLYVFTWSLVLQLLSALCSEWLKDPISGARAHRQASRVC